ncbi:MAG: glycoside hydrolase family 43 protein [Bacteroidales bacterium]|nr:glycoside hydrolase family 43 protein [Bacteroidales bacterium]
MFNIYDIRFWLLPLIILITSDIGQDPVRKDPAKPLKHFTNPIFDGADPWMIQKDKYYYYCFSSGNGIYVSRSEFITRRGEPVRVWQAPESGWNSSCVWAPELHYIDNHWYIYYAAGESGPPYVHQKTGVLQSLNDDALGGYKDLGTVYTGDNPDLKSDNIWAIDMTVFRHREKLYSVWSGWEKPAETDKTPQHLYIAEMENPFTVRSPRIKISSPSEPWETGGPLDLQEGPQVLKKGDNLFIVYSCRESWTVDYRLGILKLKNPGSDPLSPESWEKTGPVFSGPFGTGHCSFVKSPDGLEDWIIYHSKKSVKEGWQRDIRAQRFGWDPKGYPVFGEAVKAGESIARPSGEYRLEKKLKRTGKAF